MSNEYSEYRTNLYTQSAMGCVRADGDTNVYVDSIPLAKVRERFAREDVTPMPAAYIGHGGDSVTEIPGLSVWARNTDSHVYPRLVDSETTPEQYGFLVDMATGLTGEGSDIIVTAAGTTRNGGRAYIQLTSTIIRESAGMQHCQYLNLAMSHDGSLAVVSNWGDRVIQCANMVASMFGRNVLSGTRTRQTKHASSTRHLTRHAVALGFEQRATEFDTAIAELAAIKVSKAKYGEFVKLMFPAGDSKRSQTVSEKNIATLTGLYNSDPRVALWNGTALGVVQAVNVMSLWERATRGDTDRLVRQYDDMMSGALAKSEDAAAKVLASIL